ncbi:hypothetical protein B0H12DRAFT_1076615 [Mycena haematopus]|nr:hypothetical protein B0H12DRAFT_1076615 [Mycena haematopus]
MQGRNVRRRAAEDSIGAPGCGSGRQVWAAGSEWRWQQRAARAVGAGAAGGSAAAGCAQGVQREQRPVQRPAGACGVQRPLSVAGSVQQAASAAGSRWRVWGAARAAARHVGKTQRAGSGACGAENAGGLGGVVRHGDGRISKAKEARGRRVAGKKNGNHEVNCEPSLWFEGMLNGDVQERMGECLQAGFQSTRVPAAVFTVVKDA